MLNCPNCDSPYRVLTSRPMSEDVREYSCQCKDCGSRFRQFAVFEGYLVENKNAQPPNKKLQPEIAKRREKLLERLDVPLPQPREERGTGMVFKNDKK